MESDWIPVRFIDNEIEVGFDRPPTLRKKPKAPDTIIWGDEELRVMKVISEWFDTRRRGEMSRNMSEEHLRVAEQRGSWGVGRFFFRVRVEDGRVFDVYYDRAPKKAADRMGHWFLLREMEAQKRS
ncbi:MAG: DUF6504 family protein [Anaerolineales bacterium]|jgi:hypothetical protein